MGIEIYISPGELMDRMSILSVKVRNMTDTVKRQMATRELAVLEQAWEDSSYRKVGDITLLSGKLFDVNQRLWHLENAMRDPTTRANSELLASVARCVSAENDLRASIKAFINKMLDSDIVEVKQHGSA